METWFSVAVGLRREALPGPLRRKVRQRGTKPMAKTMKRPNSVLNPSDTFLHRHIGPTDNDVRQMLAELGYDSLEQLALAVVPASIRLERPLALGEPRGEHELLEALREIARDNRLTRSFIGMGYHACITPPVIQRNILENPGWYTQYTPYQAEISQGRLEALLNFQTMIAELTALPMANASLLDEATAAAEAMSMCHAITRRKRAGFFVADGCHPQTIEVVRTRAEASGLQLHVGEPTTADPVSQDLFGILLQYPTTDGRILDYSEIVETAHASGALVVVAADPLALVLLRPPGEFGADIAVGSTQRFGVPPGYGGPHAGYLATRDEYKRQVPGRVVGLSRDAGGKPAYRLALQTREQHIRRDKATSNICTAQVLLAIMAGMYAVYHGPDGLRRIAERVHGMTRALAAGLRRAGLELGGEPFFDTLRVGVADARAVHRRAQERDIDLRRYTDDSVGVSLDETTTRQDIRVLVEILAGDGAAKFDPDEILEGSGTDLETPFARSGPCVSHEIFRSYHAEHEFLRYVHRLQGRDISLTQSMIPLGSCTMKLNGTSLMLPVSWPEFAQLHPFVPPGQAAGFARLFDELESWLCEITGFAAVSLQPNAGAQGEYAGLLVIRAYHRERGDEQRNVCLIPTSAHGTNPASAVMAGMQVVPVVCDERGNVDLDDLRAKADQHRQRLAALMITYPSTHGVFEEEIRNICDIVHENGGQVYMDGANMNAQVGLCRPGDIGADVCHLNLHKTFCIPHGGGGPGMGPIAVAAHLAPFLPSHPVVPTGGESSIGPVAAAPYGSPSILPISWVYIALMGEKGLRRASQVAILNANYMARRLSEHYPVLFTGATGLVAHEFILDLRPFKQRTGVTADDVAKRLMDFGIHAPTMSFPVIGTLMVEPTESESRAELDRFCEAMTVIREEIRDIEEGRIELEQSPLRRAPHTAEALLDDDWNRPYSRECGAYPADWVRDNKFWPAVGRIDNAHGDRHLICTCPPMDSYEDD
jgi:glycine dehydrogenase